MKFIFDTGGLFHQKNVGVESLEEIIFRIAIDLANDETEKDLQLSWEMEAIDEYDSIAVKAAGRLVIRYNTGGKN